MEMDFEKIMKKKNALHDNYYLLAGRDKSLENAVYKAFKLLGFREIKKKRSPVKEDWVIKFKSKDRTCEYGIIEVKGSNTRTGRESLRQCSDWTTDFEKEFNVIAKGIFVPNQYRLRPYPESKNDRLKFEPDEIKFSKHHRICILPSCLLFENIKKVLLTGNNNCRDIIESAIEPTEGILEKML